MLKRHSQFLQSLLFLFDLTVICGCWFLAYYLRFLEGLAPIDKGIPPFEIYLWLLIPILVVWGISFRAFNLYRPRRMGSHLAEFLDIAKANTLSVLVLVAFTAFHRQFEYSRLVFLYFWLLNLVALGFSRMAFREGLRFMRKQGFNQRHALVIGAGKLGQRVARLIAIHSEFGIKIQGFLTRHPNKLGQTYEGIRVSGLYSDIEKYAPALDIVFVCLPPDEEQGAEKILQFCVVDVPQQPKSPKRAQA